MKSRIAKTRRAPAGAYNRKWLLGLKPPLRVLWMKLRELENPKGVASVSVNELVKAIGETRPVWTARHLSLLIKLGFVSEMRRGESWDDRGQYGTRAPDVPDDDDDDEKLQGENQ